LKREPALAYNIEKGKQPAGQEYDFEVISMLYPINKVEKILGVSQSTIRRYVDAGIIHARRAEESAYRYFSIRDIAEMGVYVGMRRQEFLPRQISRVKGEGTNYLDFAEQTLREIDERIERLQADRVCWVRHMELLELIDRAQESPLGGVLCQRDTLIGSSFDNEESLYNNLFYTLLRENSISYRYFRLCCRYSEGEGGLVGRQAYLAPLNLLRPEDVLNISGKVLLPKQTCIAAPCPGSNVIDDEDPAETAKNTQRVQALAEELLGKFHRERDGEILSMTVHGSPGPWQALLFIPVKG